MSIPKKVISHLNTVKMGYQTITHRTVFTAYDLAQTLQRKLDEIAKTLLIKVDADYYLVILPASKKLDINKLKKILKAKKVSIAKEDDMKSKFNVKPGAITPFGSLHKVPVVIDSSLAKAKEALFGAGSFTESLVVKVKDFISHEEPIVGAIGISSGLKLQTPKKAVNKKVKPKKKTIAKKSKLKKK